MRREGRGRFDSAGRQIDLGEAAALAGIEQAGRQAEMFAPYAEVDPGLFYSGARAGLPIVQMAETRRGERRADARGAAAQAAAEAEQQATMGYLSQYLGVPPELIAALSSVGQLGDLFPEFEEPDPTWIYDETGRLIGHDDLGVWQDYQLGERKLNPPREEVKAAEYVNLVGDEGYRNLVDEYTKETSRGPETDWDSVDRDIAIALYLARLQQ